MTDLLGDVTPVLMAKWPESGRVKTRLAEGGPFSPRHAAEVAEAMLRCMAQRLAAAARRTVLAVDPSGCGSALAARLGLERVRVVEQGPGDLGERLARVWRAVEENGPIAFFGGDSPDVPDEALGAIPEALRECEIAVGPTDDGGYWTLAGRTPQPSLLAGIDWGTASVYDQTCRRAAARGLSVRSLALWHDVDRPEDMDGLRRRLQHLLSDPDASAPLRTLAGRLEALSSHTHDQG